MAQDGGERGCGQGLGARQISLGREKGSASTSLPDPLSKGQSTSQRGQGSWQKRGVMWKEGPTQQVSAASADVQAQNT